MKTTINGQPITQAIAMTVLQQIQKANPDIDLKEYDKLEDVPGFKEAMDQPRYISFSQEDENAYKQVLRRIQITKNLHKTAYIDLRRKADGTQSVAALNKRRLLWEINVGWDILIGLRH